MSLLSMTCIFKPAWLLIAFQQQVADITIHMSKNDGLENYLKKKEKRKKKFFLYFHILEVLPHSRESGCISGRLPDDPGGFTCMVEEKREERKKKHIGPTTILYTCINFDIKNKI